MEAVPNSARRDIRLHEQIIALDKKKPYPVDKLEAHLSNIRHLAISTFVFHNGELLVQQRAATKYHSAGLWANTVCSHPRWGETVSDCADRRLREELNWNTPLEEFGIIDYCAKVGELFENESVHCFSGVLQERPSGDNFNPLEVAAVEWLSLQEIDRRIAEQPEVFTEWFKIYMTNHRDMIVGRFK